jgi:hypothetical protein
VTSAAAVAPRPAAESFQTKAGMEAGGGRADHRRQASSSRQRRAKLGGNAAPREASGEPRPYQEVKAEAFEAEAPTAKN